MLIKQIRTLRLRWPGQALVMYLVVHHGYPGVLRTQRLALQLRNQVTFLLNAILRALQ